MRQILPVVTFIALFSSGAFANEGGLNQELGTPLLAPAKQIRIVSVNKPIAGELVSASIRLSCERPYLKIMLEKCGEVRRTVQANSEGLLVLPAIYKPRVTEKSFAEPERYNLSVMFYVKGPSGNLKSIGHLFYSQRPDLKVYEKLASDLYVVDVSDKRLPIKIGSGDLAGSFASSRDEAQLMVRIKTRDTGDQNFGNLATTHYSNSVLGSRISATSYLLDLPVVSTGEMYIGSFNKNILDQSVYMDLHLGLKNSRGWVALHNLPIKKLLAEDFSGFDLNMKIVEN